MWYDYRERSGEERTSTDRLQSAGIVADGDPIDDDHTCLGRW